MRILIGSLTSFCAAIAMVCLAWVSPGSAQTTQGVAAASEAQVSSGRPSTLQIRRNVLLQQQAVLEDQIRAATRCIQDATKPQTLRDPQGNINQVPQTDITNCSRQLRTFQRQLASLARQFERLASDANAAAAQFQTRQEFAQRSLRTRWLTGQ
jgi:hypothetical protein